MDIGKAREAEMYLQNIGMLESVLRNMQNSDLYKIKFVRRMSDGAYVDAEREFDGLGRYVAMARECFEKSIKDDINHYKIRIEEL